MVVGDEPADESDATEKYADVGVDSGCGPSDGVWTSDRCCGWVCTLGRIGEEGPFTELVPDNGRA